MAENKKSVLLYCDIIHTVDEISDEEAGKLFKHYLRYINDLNPEPPDKLTKVLFEPIKQTLKRDLKKWESIICKRSEAGLASAKKRQHKSTSVDTSQQVSTVIVKDIVKEINTMANEFNFSFVEKDFRLPFLDWYKYRIEIKKPFKIQRSIESSYRELKELSGNNPIEASKIVQYSISNQYLSLIKPEQKQNNAPVILQGTI